VDAPGRIGVTSDQSSRVLAGEKRRVPVDATRPESSCSIIHFAMSAAVELMPPAGLVLSLVIGATGLTRPSTSACGVATLPPRAASEWRTVLPVMPIGSRSRVRTKSSQLFPDTRSMSCPATR
jgi:hypothetical protein